MPEFPVSKELGKKIDDLSSQAKGSDPDIIVASAKAYINALNRLIFKKTKSIKENSASLKIEGV